MYSETMTKSQRKCQREEELPSLAKLDWDQVSVVKGRLRKAIQDKRAMNGKDALRLDFILDSPIKDKNLAPEELIHIQRRAHIRKERNRLAAQRMRERRKSYCDKLVKELETLEDSNSQLVWELRNLEVEKNKLESILKSHLKNCDTVKPTSSSGENVEQPMQPLDLSVKPCDSPLLDAPDLQICQKPVQLDVKEQEAPLDLRVLKRHCSVIENGEATLSRRPRLSSV